jgi:anti-anti-sigma factor
MDDIGLHKNGDRATVTLGGELTVRQARKLKAALLDAMQSCATIEVVLGSISKMDSSLLQVLCSAQRTAAGLQKRFAVYGSDQERFADLLRRTGFTRHTGGRGNARTACGWLHGPASE